MPITSDDPDALEEFAASLGARDPKTRATYVSTIRHLLLWLALQPGGTQFHPGLFTETALRHYMNALQQAGRAPRTRSRALAALRRFGQWAVEEGYLHRNPARTMACPMVVAMAPKELSDQQRYVLGTMVERRGIPRVSAIFALESGFRPVHGAADPCSHLEG